MLLTGIFILFWLQYQFTIMKLQDLVDSSFLSKSAQVISIKGSKYIQIMRSFTCFLNLKKSRVYFVKSSSSLECPPKA